MKIEEIAVQLYCFKDYIKTRDGLEDTFRRLHEIGYKSIQMTAAIPETIPDEEIQSLLDRYGLKFISAHIKSGDLFSATDAVIARLKKFNIPHAAYPNPHFSPTGVGEITGLAERLNELALKFRDNGIILSYHNHAIEFKRFEGRLMLDLIFENAPDLQGELDTHWVHRGGGDVIKWIRKLAGRMEYMHIKDYGVNSTNVSDIWSNVPVMLPIGSGNLDWEGIFAASAESGVRYFIIEHDKDIVDPFESFTASFRYLTENFVK